MYLVSLQRQMNLTSASELPEATENEPDRLLHP